MTKTVYKNRLDSFYWVLNPELPMLLTLTITLSVLLIINFLLLKFSCNKTVRNTKQNSKPLVVRPEVPVKSIPRRLAPTGS